MADPPPKRRRRMPRRIDNLALRWQARLDSAWADQTLPWLLAGGLFALLLALSLARYRSLDQELSLAVHVQASWLLSEEGTTRTTLSGFTVPEQSGAWAFLPLGWLTQWLPRAPTLLAAQAAALAAGLLPLWRLARRWARLRAGVTVAVAVAYAANPVVHNLNLAGFHPESLALPGLLMLANRGLAGSRWRALAGGLWAVLWAPHTALVLVGLGVVLARSERFRLGVGVAVAGVGLLVAIPFVDGLGSGDGLAPMAGAYLGWGEGAWSVVGGALGRPLEAAGAVVGAAKFRWLVLLLAPVAFLPLLRPRFLAPALPWLVMVALGDYGPEADVPAVAGAPALPFVMLAAVAGLGSVGRRQLDRVAVDVRLSAALVGTAVVGFLLWGAPSLYQQPWRWGGRDAADLDRLTMIERVDGAAAVAATEGLLVPLAGRADLVRYTPGSPVPEGIDVVLIDEADVADGEPQPSPATWREVGRLGEVVLYRPAP
jgi:hypothetical protein